MAKLNWHCLDFWVTSPFLSYGNGMEYLPRTQATNARHLGSQASVLDTASSLAEEYCLPSLASSALVLWYSGWLMGCKCQLLQEGLTSRTHTKNCPDWGLVIGSCAGNRWYSQVAYVWSLSKAACGLQRDLFKHVPHGGGGALLELLGPEALRLAGL